MALLAGRRKPGDNMVGICGALKFPGVAGITLCREPLKLSRGGAGVAGPAIHRRVRADEREAILVIADRLHRNRPALYRVTLFAIRAELTAMNIGMAVRARRTHIGEH
jgi:hypothetical protein